MKNQWTNFLAGYIRVKADGIGTERVINKLIKQNIYIWNVKRAGSHSILFNIQLKEMHKFRNAVRNSDCKLSFLEGRGGPFLFKRLLKNSGFLAGFLAFVVLIFLLSNMVWGIEIRGAKPETEHLIRKELDKMGVEKGKIQFLLDDADDIQRKLTNNISALTWIGVELKGTTFHFQVVEKKQPDEQVKLSPRNLVAGKKAVISKMFVVKGQSVVAVHDYVKKGQMLVSGTIGNPDKPKIVAADGEVWGETWYKSQVEVPLITNFSVFNGRESVKHYIKIAKFSIPVWNFKKPDYKNFETELSERPLKFLKWELPIHYKTATHREKEDVTRKYSVKEAVSKAREMGKKDLMKLIPEDSKIVGEKILHQTTDSGKVKLSLHYQVIENIAVGQPIIQGD
ncbi:sporulation protein YqfD [Peribacillus deserti]|uniref:Sporulation protein YqfD n=1 Tax=Peribacillus deserti TaxID=673318 RepID=A0A2N5M9G1_9BACI|nr:sporulation protein YqfD [Peribacillus deserti]PLT30965.1 sporulation protein YqfD [Peribacillus deserti]